MNISTAANVIPFSFHAREVRAVVINDQPWFVAADVCRILGQSNTTKALYALDDDERSNFKLGRQGLVNIINESGLYTLILRCDDAIKKGSDAHAFRKWVTAEVLPAIRRSGLYEDRQNKMSTLVDELIGMTEVNVIKGLIRDKAKVIPIDRRRSFQLAMHNRLHTRFNVPRVELIPGNQFEAACNFVAAYALEGEWLPKEGKPGTFVLDQYAAQYISSLVHYSYWVCYRWDQGIGSAVKALNPKFHTKTWEFFRELQVCAEMIERASPELIAHFRSPEGRGLRPQDCIATGRPTGHPAD